RYVRFCSAAWKRRNRRASSSPSFCASLEAGGVALAIVRVGERRFCTAKKLMNRLQPSQAPKRNVAILRVCMDSHSVAQARTQNARRKKEKGSRTPLRRVVCGRFLNCDFLVPF